MVWEGGGGGGYMSNSQLEHRVFEGEYKTGTLEPES